ncbi:MAG: hypothetical protein ACYYKD_03470 [Rhodospirillales bacterium]
MSKHLFYAAVAGLALLAVLLRFAGDAAPLIVAAPIALTFGWHIFSTLEVKAAKRRADTADDIDDLVVSPLRATLAQLADSKDDFDYTLQKMTGALMISRLNQVNAEIFRQLTALVNVCGRIENYGHPEFGSGWPELADAAQDQVSSGFEKLLESGGAPAFDEGAVLVRRGLENLHTAAEQKIRKLRKKAG